MSTKRKCKSENILSYLGKKHESESEIVNVSVNFHVLFFLLLNYLKNASRLNLD